MSPWYNGLFFFLLMMVCRPGQGEVILEKREEALQNFPCMTCHKSFQNEQAFFPPRRPHESLEFRHHDSIQNCFSCHDKSDRNLLVLPTGKKIRFNESYQTCIHCHGEKGRDFKRGIHGKQIGSWKEDQFRFSCTHCHDPHSPAFKKMPADPGPPPPRGRGTLKGKH